MKEFVSKVGEYGEYELPKDKEFKEEDFRLDRPETIRINYWPRSTQNKVFVAIYRIFRFINVTLWTYYLPIIALIA